MARMARLVIYDGTEREIEEARARSMSVGVHVDKHPIITIIDLPPTFLAFLGKLVRDAQELVHQNAHD